MYQLYHPPTPPPTFLATVDDQTAAALLRTENALLDAVCQIGPAGADVTSEDITAIALVMRAHGELLGGVGEMGDIAEYIDGHAADGGQEDIQLGTRDQLGVHAVGLGVQGLPQRLFADVEALGDAGQPPDRVDRHLGHHHLAALQHQLVVHLDRPVPDVLHQLYDQDVRLSHRDRRTDVHPRVDLLLKRQLSHVPPRVQRADLLLVVPLRLKLAVTFCIICYVKYYMLL